MRFMLMIVDPRGQRDTRSEDEGREEALELAKTSPAARFATVEVRECAPCYVQ